jgi:effector-binding domain-containing protein
LFDIKVKREPSVTYASLRKEVRSAEIDGFVRKSIVELRERFATDGRPFAMYMGCDKDDAQLVEVCLPTRDGENVLPEGEVAYTTARGRECEYPDVLSAYDAVTTYVGNSGRAFAGPPREVYLTDFDADEELVMQICFPLS